MSARTEPTDTPAVEQEELTPDQAARQSALTAAIAHAADQHDAELKELQRVRPWGYTNSPGAAQLDVLADLAAMVKLREATELRMLELIRIARKNTGSEWYPNSASWETVGKQLGVTKQSAQAKYGKKL